MHGQKISKFLFNESINFDCKKIFFSISIIKYVGKLIIPDRAENVQALSMLCVVYINMCTYECLYLVRLDVCAYENVFPLSLSLSLWTFVGLWSVPLTQRLNS